MHFLCTVYNRKFSGQTCFNLHPCWDRKAITVFFLVEYTRSTGGLSKSMCQVILQSKSEKHSFLLVRQIRNTTYWLEGIRRSKVLTLPLISWVQDFSLTSQTMDSLHLWQRNRYLCSHFEWRDFASLSLETHWWIQRWATSISFVLERHSFAPNEWRLIRI